jgi:23S rRNA (uracil1939-C5)-methyltransferase
MGRKKKDIVLTGVNMIGIADEGRCVGKTAEGQVVFASGAVPGDVADVLVTKKRKGHMLGRVQQIHSYSPDRLAPFCAHFGACGGCKWQHLDYAAQLRQKETVVRDALQRIAKVEVGEWQPILGSAESRFYRNKMEFAFSSRRWLAPDEMNQGISNQSDVLGFHPAGGFDKVIDILECHLQADPSNEIRNAARAIGQEQELDFYNIKSHQGFLRTLLLRTSSLGETMVLVSFGEDDAEKRTAYLSELQRRCPQITSLLYCINTKFNDTIWDLPVETWHGEPYIEEMLGEVRFRIGPKSFFQTNTRQAKALYDVVAEFANLQGHENVYDLYTGIGSIGLYLARKCKQVVGIEEVAPAIDDAKINAQLNGIQQVKFYVGDVKNILTSEFAQVHGKPDVLITDPPRAGMHEDVANMLLELATPRVVYVSCNPATQARDLQRLSARYDVKKVRPVDMFPHTHHIESVALLELKG